MKTTKKIFLLITLISIIGITNSFAQNAMGRYEQKQNCTKALDLNEEQEKKMEELRLKHQKSLLDIQNQINEKQARKKTLETADNVDMKAINKVNEEIGKLQTEKMNLCSSHKQEVRKILTPEQKIKYDSFCSNKDMKKCCNSKMGQGNMNNRPCNKENMQNNCPKTRRGNNN